MSKNLYLCIFWLIIKTPLSVCNNFLLQSHMEFGRLLLLQYAIYSLLYRCTHSSQENHKQTVFYRNRVFIILYNLAPTNCNRLNYCISFNIIVLSLLVEIYN